jgi:hypothetical protein
VHPDFHTWFVRYLPLNYKHAIFAIVRDSILLDNIAQGKYVGECLLVIPYISMISSHFCLAVYLRGPTIALQLHLCAGSEDLLDWGWVADGVHGGLAVRYYDLPQIKRHASTMCLLERLCDSWFELAFHLRELESVAGDLEMRLPLRRVRSRDVGVFFGLFELCECLFYALYFLSSFLTLAGTRLRVILVVAIWAVRRWTSHVITLETSLVGPIFLVESHCLAFCSGLVGFSFTSLLRKR